MLVPSATVPTSNRKCLNSEGICNKKNDIPIYNAILRQCCHSKFHLSYPLLILISLCSHIQNCFSNTQYRLNNNYSYGCIFRLLSITSLILKQNKYAEEQRILLLPLYKSCSLDLCSRKLPYFMSTMKMLLSNLIKI